MMHRLGTIAGALILGVLGCSGSDPAQPVVPTPSTTDEQIIADCYEIQAALEAFADTHAGEYPSHWQDVDAFEGSVQRPNRYTGFETEPRLVQAYWPGQIGVTLYYEIDGSNDVHGYRIEGRGADGPLVVLENTSAVSVDVLSAYQTLLDELEVIVAALEQFADEAGWYPDGVGSEQTPQGDFLVDLLPEGELLTDPFTGYQVNPSDGGASHPGAIGYLPHDPTGTGRLIFYDLDALGPANSRISVRTPYSDEDRHTRTSMLLLELAVEVFRADSGHLPLNVDLDETPSGDTVLDLILFPLANVYTGAEMTPRNGLATVPGEIGYMPVVENDIVVGYIINGFGIVQEFHRIEVLP